MVVLSRVCGAWGECGSPDGAVDARTEVPPRPVFRVVAEAVSVVLRNYRLRN